MPSTYTTRNRLEKIATGEKLNIWGESQNAGTLDPLDQTLDGVGTVDLGNATTFDLTTATYVKNGEADTARCRVLEFSNANAAGTLVTILGVQKVYFIRNLSANPITIAPTGGVVATVRGGQKTWVYSNGTNCYALNDPTLDQILPPAATVNLGSQKMQSSAAPTTGNDFVNKTYADAIITVASGYATAAGNSATAANASAVAAALSLSTFQGQYASSASEPGSPDAGDLWFDEANDQFKVRNSSNTAWLLITVGNAATETVQGLIEIADQSEFNAGTDDERAATTKKIHDSGIVAFTHHLLHVTDEKTNNTAGKSYSATTWNTADLNTVKTNQISGASLATNQISLPAGTYFAEIVTGHTGSGATTVAGRARLRDVTNSVTLAASSNNRASNVATSSSLLSGRFTLSGTATIELQVYPSGTSLAGAVVNSGEVEVYSHVLIWKMP